MSLFRMAMQADKKLRFSLLHLQYLSSIILTAALGLGLYNQWQFSEDPVILVIALLALFVFGISCALQYYFHFHAIGQALSHIWLGCILGIIIFSKKKEMEYATTEEVMDILLVTSVVVGCFWSVVTRVIHIRKLEPVMFSRIEILECIGMLAATFVTGNEAVLLILLLVAFELNLIAIRLKSFTGLFSLMCFVSLSTTFFFKDLKLSINIYGLVCFIGKHAFEPIIDLYFSGFSSLERWQIFFNKPIVVKHLIVVLIFVLNLAVGALFVEQIANHEGWIVMSMFVVFAVFWLSFHLASFLICWRLMSKITECNKIYNSISDERKSMTRIMSSKGMQYFGIISRRIVCLTLISTIIFGVIGWTLRTEYSVVLIIIPIESMTLSLFWELGDYLGGTAIGYAIIAPVIQSRTLPAATLLSASKSGIGALTLHKISQFFDFNMIYNGGLDLSTSGFEADHLESKVKKFFDRRMSNGVRYGAYILFYNGEVYDNGDWALADGISLPLDTLLNWWATRNGNACARLILILDTVHSNIWAKRIEDINGQYVAIQTCQFVKSKDAESGNVCQDGAFTQDWVHYNLEADIDPDWTDKDRAIKAMYKVSKNWTDFTLNFQTEMDTAPFLEDNVPKIIRPLLRIVNFGQTERMCCCSKFVKQCFERIKMIFFPPKELDTGYGFKLVSS